MKTIYLIIIIFSYFCFAQENNITVKLTKAKYSNLDLDYSSLGEDRLLVKVNYPSGNPVEKLSRLDFYIEENGYPADIISVNPLSESVEVDMKIFLCIDNSASMDNYVDDLLAILDELVEKLPRSAEITLITFDNKFALNKLTYKGEYLNISISHFFKEIWKLKKNYHMKFKQHELSLTTNLYDQMYGAFELANLSKYEGKDIYYIILSDGNDIGSRVNSEEVINNYRKGKVFAIDFSRNSKIDFLEKLTDISFGQLFEAKNTDELKQYFNEIGERIIFTGYDIKYISSLPPQIFLPNIYELRNSQKMNVAQIRIEEVKSRELFPILNYIFFDKSSSEINNRYKLLNNLETFEFRETNLIPNQIEIYWNILNIIGSRMRLYSNAVIELLGCNDNTENEKNNIELSKNRALKIKDYFVNVWGIAESRVITKSRNLPIKYSNKTKEYGHAENRRVEIYSDTPEILDVVEAYSVSNITSPEAIQMPYQVKGNSPIARWELKVVQGDQDIYYKSETGALPDKIAWNIAPSLAGKKLTNSDLEITLKAEDENGRMSSPCIYRAKIDFYSSERKKMEQIGDKTMEKLSLVLFEFNSSNLDARNKDILMKVKNSFKENSTIIVKGYTDDSGDENLNKKLSDERAKNTLNSIVKLLNPKVADMSYEGLGEWAPLYENKLPEGRFYNRTCQLVIETPISER